MEADRFAENYVLANREYFPQEKIALLKDKLSRMEEEKQIAVQSVPLKNPTVTLLLAVFAGALGADRFYIGDILLGVLKLLLSLIFVGLIWAIIDIYICYKKTKEMNFQNVSMYI